MSEPHPATQDSEVPTYNCFIVATSISVTSDVRTTFVPLARFSLRVPTYVMSIYADISN